MPSPAVAEALRQVEALIDALAAEHPDLADDERAWLATLEGQSSVVEIATHLQAKALERQRLAEDAERQLTALGERARRFWQQAARFEHQVSEIMGAAKLRRIETAAFDITRRQGPVKVEIEDPSRLPADMLRQPDPVPDKIKIKAALQQQGSQAVPGARLVEGAYFLQIRTK